MLIIPLRAIPSQTLTLQLAGQPCRINVYQKTTALFVDLYVNDSPIITGVPAWNANKIVRDAYLGFIGDLAFFDTVGSADPDYTGLGARWPLYYLEASDL